MNANKRIFKCPHFNVFIAFSFTGTISVLISLLQKGIGKFRSHLENRKVSQASNLQNLEDKERLEEVMEAKFAEIETKLEYLMNNSDRSRRQNQPFYI